MKPVISALEPMLLLSACTSPIEPVSVQMIRILPPEGLIVPCDKPSLVGRTPIQTLSTDIPNLKRALKECAFQAESYLKWRAAQQASDTEE